MNKIGFTGTQIGMNERQRNLLQRFMDEHQPFEFHHGDCVGADAQSHRLALLYKAKIVIHPPEVNRKRAFCKNAYSIRIVEPYLDRNRSIVDETDVLIAIPKESQMQIRSGTWYTVRYARKKNKPVYIIYPNELKIVTLA